MGRLLLSLGLVLFVAACGSGRPFAPEPVVQHAAFVDTKDPPSITLFTSIRSAAGTGAHSAVLINASERVIFDPAGSFETETRGVAPIRGDVIYGVTDPVLDAYRRFQSSTGYHVVAITVPVPAAVAEEALHKAEDHGWVSQAFCADASSHLISSLPGFERVHPTLFPRAFMLQMEKMPGATIRTYLKGVEIPNGSAPHSRAALPDFPDGLPG
ncbi:hypothetical protein [Solirhodobacter olei]|uniref:hypothetical protein n=1 Tax=Solirhodobacter olei TaxID=2493082 RepID=UPI000FDC3D47|nr:hypothetical protein [Solirhodobacter olei]